MAVVNEIIKKLPTDASITGSNYEGANIVIYTKSKSFFKHGSDTIRFLVDEFKKRIDLRADSAIRTDEETAKSAIEKIISRDAEVTQIIFEPARSLVTIEAKKPGIVIGKSGDVLQEIKDTTFWTPIVKRDSIIPSKITTGIREALYADSAERKKFLDRVGKRIYEEKRSSSSEMWARVVVLGAGRQVGRSCFLLQTPESNILLDCGVNVADEKSPYPYLTAPEFNIQAIDAVIISHAHMDHMGMVPFIVKMGYTGPIYCTEVTRDVMALLQLDYIDVSHAQTKKPPYSSTDIKNMVKQTICLEYGEVTDITPDVRITFYNAGHIIGSSLVHLHIGEGWHNLLYSLDGKTAAVVIDKNNNVLSKPIGEIVDKEFKSSNAVIINSNVEQIPNLSGLKAVVFNPRTLKNEIKEITSFVRHPINEDLCRITTKSGREITVTKSHSIFTVKDGKLRAVKVSDLTNNDFIIGPKQIPFISDKKKNISLLDNLKDLRIQIKDNKLLCQILKSHKLKFDLLKQSDALQASDWIKDHYSLAMYKEDLAKKYHVKLDRIRRTFKQLGISDHPRVGHSFPDTFEITPEFSRFLGYYISEGSIQNNTIQIANYNPTILEDSYNIISSTFGLKGDIRDRSVMFFSKQLKYLINKVLNCGEGAYHKRVPPQVLYGSREIAANFLKGYFSGDGGVTIKSSGRVIDASSKNSDLIQDVAFLLLQFGIVPTLQHNKTTDMYIASIYNTDKIKHFLGEVGMLNSAIENLNKEIGNLKRKKGSFDMRIPLSALSKEGQIKLFKTGYRMSKTCGINILQRMRGFNEVDKKIIESDLMFDQIKNIEKVKPSGKYVYDFQIDGYENFSAGNGFLFVHNTGDYKFKKSRLLDGAINKFPRVETVITESTYGGSEDFMEERSKSEDELKDIVRNTLKRKGKVLMPVLGVGRSQEIMLILEEMFRKEKIKSKIYIDGMVWDITAIHNAYPRFMNTDVRQKVFYEGNDPFLSESFSQVGSYQERQKVLEGGSCVILATSGMLVGGASCTYLRELAKDKKNCLIFSCYQGEGSLGARIQRGDKELKIEGEREIIPLNMEVHTIPGLSGHSDRNELMSFIQSMQPAPRKVIINHGESSKCLNLASSIHKICKIETVAPRNLESIRLR